MALLSATSVFTSPLGCYSRSHGLDKRRHATLSLQRQTVPGYSSKRKSKAGALRITADIADDVRPAAEVLTRKNFPCDFKFGAATSAYQIEGAWDEDGRGISIWDHYCHTYPGRIMLRSKKSNDENHQTNGDVATKSYNMYKEDVKMLKAMGMNAYRFSISWPRILPDGRGRPNQEGVVYYHKLIDELLDNGITPYVTLFHWDVPYALEEEYGGFLSRKILQDFKAFAELCFTEFGCKVKHWFTLNEPYIFCTMGYGTGGLAPGRCSPWRDCAVPHGDSLREPYIAGHHQILAHAEVVRLYKEKFQCHQGGEIGIALVSSGYEPYDPNNHFDRQAQNRAIDFYLGWFLEPLVRGDYPFIMRAIVGDRLQYFTKEEQELIKGSYDMIGLNYYTSLLARGIDISPDFKPQINTDDVYAVTTSVDICNRPIGTPTGTWIRVYPDGLKNLLMIIKDRYGNPPVYITENGMADVDNGDLPMEDARNDTPRRDYLKVHIATVREAMDAGAKVKGHFTWSLLDNFEWVSGYTYRFGLVYVDYENGCKRHMKESAKWFASFNGKIERTTL